MLKDLYIHKLSSYIPPSKLPPPRSPTPARPATPEEEEETDPKKIAEKKAAAPTYTVPLVNVTRPIAFGSITGWRAIEMVPVPIYTMHTLANQVVNAVQRTADDFLEPAEMKAELEQLLNMVHGFGDYARTQAQPGEAKKVERILCGNSPIEQQSDFLTYIREKCYAEHMRTANRFGRIDTTTPDSNAFILDHFSHSAQLKHILIIYDPSVDKFYSRNLLLDAKRSTSTLQLTLEPPLSAPFKTIFD